MFFAPQEYLHRKRETRSWNSITTTTATVRTAAAVKLRMWEEYKLDDDDDDAGLHKIKPIKGVINSLKLFIFGFDLAVQVPLCVSLGYSRGNNIIIVEYSSNYPNYYYLILMKYSLWKIMDTLSILRYLSFVYTHPDVCIEYKQPFLYLLYGRTYIHIASRALWKHTSRNAISPANVKLWT